MTNNIKNLTVNELTAVNGGTGVHAARLQDRQVSCMRNTSPEADSQKCIHGRRNEACH